MPFNGSGIYVPIAAPDFPAVPNTTIRSSQYNNQIHDIAMALSQCLTRDGQSSALGDIPMGGFTFNNLADAIGFGQPLTWGSHGTLLSLDIFASGFYPGSGLITGNWSTRDDKQATFRTSHAYGDTYVKAEPDPASATGKYSGFHAVYGAAGARSHYAEMRFTDYGLELTSGRNGLNAFMDLNLICGGDYQLILKPTAYAPIEFYRSIKLTPGTNLQFSGTGQRITGDLSNATLANRLMFQSSTVNGVTDVGVAPNGTSTTAGITAYNAKDPTNASTTTLQTTSTQSKLIAGKTGTGSYKPLALNVGGADVATYSEAAATLGDMTASVNRNSALTHQLSNTDAGAAAYAQHKLTSNAGSLSIYQGSTAAGGSSNLLTTGTALSVGTTSSATVYLVTNGAAAATIDASGNVLAVKPTGGLGYGAGAGGTVTQTTSKSTAVTLNNPCGRITMNAAALAAGAVVSFQFNCTLLTAQDTLVVSLPYDAAINPANYELSANCLASAAVVYLRNRTGSPLSDAVYFDYKIIKGSNS